MKYLLQISNLSITFRVRKTEFEAVKNLNLTIEENQVAGLVGESGSGKSVTAMSIMRLLPEPKAKFSSESSIIFNGEDVLKASPKELRQLRGNEIAMIFQEPMTSLNPYHRVGDQIIESIQLHKSQPKFNATIEAKELMSLVEIPEVDRRFSSYPHELSGGQRQRIMIAMALANKPKLLIADEPTTALDVTIQAQILDLMTKLKNEIGMSVLFITHDLGLIERFSDTITVMQEGRVVEQGITSEVFSNPQHEYTQKLINAEPSAKKEIITSEAPIISVKNLNVFYPLPKTKLFKKEFFHAVKDVNFSIPTNSTIGLVGESGSGKSTLGKALAGLINYEGSVEYQGNITEDLNPKQSKALKKDIQIIFQDPYGSLSPRMTIGEIVGEGLDVHFLLNSKEKEDRIAECLKAVEINPDHRFKYPHEFSGGQRQRVAIARSLILNPAFMILDEPTSALDRSIQIQVIELLKNLQDKFQLTYLFISHDLKVVRSMSDYIFVMQNGVIVESGSADQVFSNPEQDYTDKLLNAALKYSTA
ncbi:dipeptide ABC transporter ATP-binding protein [Gammaproteobacteria bacterium]|jgi:ABC-type microcin C transport system duplicated ATPase subunit YejF|nr:dipeptide ABC transporter ATP-binding protein [Gammaproteobacteria bacterium]|tara:strand:- start:6408 stop:8006 length:1599 start_codon:yes stop_codon:yes gene_type:complete